MDHPKDIGDRSALAIAIALQGIGHAVYLPFGENTRAPPIPIEEIPLKWAGCLRVTEARNGQKLRIRYAGTTRSDA
jgi:hypothetical protein